MKEDWAYIVQCKEISTKKRQFVKKLHNKLSKEVNESQHDKVMLILNNVVKFLRSISNYKKTQQLLGGEMLFQGFIIKNWVRSENTNQYHTLNKIVIK